MANIWIVFWIHTFSVFIITEGGGDFHYASFLASTILDNTCQISNLLTARSLPSAIDCSLACARNIECRLYLYCSLTKSCKLFQDGSQCVINGDATGCTCFRLTKAYRNNNYRCPLGYHGNRCTNIYQDCSDALSNGLEYEKDVIVNIQPPNFPEPFEVSCYLKYTGWTTIYERAPTCRQETLNRTWSEYEQGFGKIIKNRWLGFHKLLKILAIPGNFVLQVNLYYIGGKCKTHYENFQIGDASTGYRLQIRYKPEVETCGDSMNSAIDLNNRAFSTYDKENNNQFCAKNMGGGWWFADHSECSRSFLTGTMGTSGVNSFWKDSLNDAYIKTIVLRMKRE